MERAVSLATQFEAFSRALQGEFHGELRGDRLIQALYATDASIYEIPPLAVAYPRVEQDVVALVRAAGAARIPLVARGAGTGIAGAALGTGVVVDFTRFMRGILEIDPQQRRVRVQPGVVLDELNAALAPLGLHCPADVATSSRATLGGMIGNNSCGSHSIYYGRTVDYVESLRVVLADGTPVDWAQQAYDELPPNAQGAIAQRPHFLAAEPRRCAAPLAPPASPLEKQIREELEAVRREMRAEVLERYPRVLRRNGGYALDRLCCSAELNPATLICGAEGTLGIMVEATLRLAPLPRHKALLVLHFDSVLDAVAATPLALRSDPAAVELIDHLILSAGAPRVPAAVRDQFLVGIPSAILVCELYAESAEQLRRRMGELEHQFRTANVGQPMQTVFDLGVQAAVWNMRNKGFGLLMSRPGDRQPHEFIEDAAVDPVHLRDYLADLNAMLVREGAGEVAHYAHASVGVIHVRPTLSLRDPQDRKRLRRIAEQTAELVLKYGGALTGEHGDGIVRSEFLPRMYGARIVAAFERIKRAFDPDGIFNPHKIVDPLPMDKCLRGGAPPAAALPILPQLDPAPHADLLAAAEMCRGVGQCRQRLVGVMCPSYLATLDEMHTPRARANALRLALSDSGYFKGLDDPALDEVMGLCIGCKACKSECPTGVDVARLKTEWLHVRMQQRGPSSADRFFAAAPRLAQLGSWFPGLANAVTQSRWMRNKLAREFGVDARIAPPRFARQTFRQWWKRRTAARSRHAMGTAIYFVDTWMNHYWPHVGVAAVRLLEAAGFEVVVPELVCCGRPQLSRGFLDEARRLARENVRRLASLLAHDDVWIVGNEPSCVLSLLDEYPALLRSPESRRVAERVRLVEALLAPRVGALAARANPQTSSRRLLVHGHCHQKALVGTADGMALLNGLPGITAIELNSGCCGMAGAFGHETEHYEVSRAIGEERLFRPIRARGDAEVAVCGFSCREQIAHHTHVPARHVLEYAADTLDS